MQKLNNFVRLLTSPFFNEFKARKVVSYVPGYPETSLQSAATAIHNNTLSNMPPASAGAGYGRDFVIGHSQGGLVSRYIDKLTAEGEFSNVPERRVNGIVTFATSNGGAQILNSLRDGLIAEYTTNTCNSLLAPTVIELVNNTPLINFFYNPTK
jgi:hypothetical protein